MNIIINRIVIKIILLVGCSLTSKEGYCDPPITDVLEVMFKGKKYYVAEVFVDHGILKNHDLCYYDYNGNYLAEVYDVARNCNPSNDSITLYSSIDRINMMKFNVFSYNDDINYFGNVLKIFRNEKVVSFKDFRENFVLLDAYHGNHGIYRYTKNLKESDNHWISKNQIEHLFCIEGQDICDYCFYTIKGILNNQRVYFIFSLHIRNK